MEISRGMPSGGGVSGVIRPSSPAGFDPSGSKRVIDRVSSARPQDSAAAEAKAKAAAQRLPVVARAQTGRLLAEPLVTMDITRAYVTAVGSQPQPVARGQLAAAQYQVVASLEQRTALVEMMGIDTFA